MTDDRRFTDGWSTETLYRHFSALLTAQEKAINLAEKNAEAWRASANEWRGAMTDRERTFMARGELDTRFASIDTQLNDLKKQVSLMAGKSSGLNAGWGYLVGAVGLIILVVQFINMMGGGAG